MQPQVPLPYGNNIHKKAHHTFTFYQKAGTSMAGESHDPSYSQEQTSHASDSTVITVGTSVRDAYRTLKDEANTPIRLPHDGATVGVLDNFRPNSDGSMGHGEKVYSIITSAGFTPAQVAKIDHGTAAASNCALSDLLFQSGDEPDSQRIDTYIELSVSHILTKTNGTLSQILDDPNNTLRTLNQSQGSSRVDAFQLLESASFYEDEDKKEQISDLGERVAKALNVDTNAPDFTHTKLRQAFVDRILSVVEDSSYIRDQQAQHVDLLLKLRDKGTLVVTSAGNNADELWDYRARGLNVPDNFDDDLCKVGPKLVVGALDDHGTADKGDDEIAFFTSLYGNVNLMANGVNVPTAGGPATGTSFASPQVTATAAHIRREHPDWSVEQVERQTKSAFTATDGFNLLR